MRRSVYRNIVEAALQGLLEFSVSELRDACPGVPSTSVNAFVHSLVVEGRVTRIGKGRYSMVPRQKYLPEITPWMKEVNAFMLSECVGACNCISEREGNLFVEVDKADLTGVLSTLRAKYVNVLHFKEIRPIIHRLKGFIVVCPFISEAPVISADGLCVSSMEKQIVDYFCSETVDKALLLRECSRCYDINRNRLLRYASRRGVRQELEEELKNALRIAI